MAKTISKKRNTRPVKKTYSSPFGIYWEKNNYVLLIAGLALLVIGYYVMSMGQWNSTASLVVSPFILIITYILIFPASIFYRKKDADEADKKQEPKV